MKTDVSDHLISVIIPIYNSAPYITDCIESVIHQIYKNIELILIDDGSSDDSVRICRNLCSTDRRIKLFLQPHKGVSAARNTGIKASSGEYLFFLDSDDAIHPQLLEYLHKLINDTHASVAAEKHALIKSENFDKKICQNISPINDKHYTYLNNTDAINSFIYNRPIEKIYAIGGKLIRRSTLPPPFFDENLTNGEDTKFIYQVLLNGSDLVFLHQSWYYYRIHTVNVSRKRTAKIWNSIYHCEKYMIYKEMKNGRTANAAYLEQILIDRMADWHAESRFNHNYVLAEYLEKEGKRERKLKLFSRISIYTKCKFFLSFYCLPLYRIMNHFAAIIPIFKK